MQFVNQNDSGSVDIGPGMDLIVSILAFVLILVVVLAIEIRQVDTEMESSVSGELYSESQNQVRELTEILSGKNDEIKSLQGQLTNRSPDVEELVSKLRRMEQDLNVAHQIAADKNARILSLEDLIETEIRKEADDYLNTIAKLELDIESTLVANGKLEVAITKANNNFRNVEQQLQSARFENENLQEVNADLQEKKIDMESVIRKANAKLNEIGRLLETVQNEKLELQADNGKLNQQNIKLTKNYDDLQTEFIEILEKMNGLQARLKNEMKRIAISLTDSRDLSFFQTGSSELTIQGRRQLYQLMPKLAEAIYQNDTNTIRIAGHASPEIFLRNRERDKQDLNLELSSQRALTVGYELSKLGIPQRCIAIEGFGRGRSESTKELSPTQTLEKFDEFLSILSGQQLERMKASFPRQRKVQIKVLSEGESQCGSELLSNSVQKAVLNANRALRAQR